MRTKAQVIKSGRKAHGKIKNKKAWKLVVHENLGWHWTLEALGGLFTLSGGYNGEERYSCLLSDSEHAWCGSIMWQDHKHFKDPNQAIAHCLRKARAVVSYLDARVTLAEGVKP